MEQKEEVEKDPTNVYIKNLPTRAECNEDWLSRALGQELVGSVTGRIVSCRVMRLSEASAGEPVGGIVRLGANGATGAGFIRFETERDAQAAVAHINRNGAMLAQKLGAVRPMEAKLADKTNQRRRQRAAAVAAAAAAASAAVAAAAASGMQHHTLSTNQTATTSLALTALSQFPALQQAASLTQPALASLIYGQQVNLAQPVARFQPGVSAPSYILATSGLMAPNQQSRNPWAVGSYDAGAAAAAAAAYASAAAAAVCPATLSSQMQPALQQQQQHQLQHFQQQYLQQPSALFADLSSTIAAASLYPHHQQHQQQHHHQVMSCDQTSAAVAFQAAAAGIYQQLANSPVDQQ